MGKKQIWSASEEEFLALTYPDLRTDEIAPALGRTVFKLYAKAKKMGLKKSPAFLDSPEACRLRRGDHPGRAFQFSPGHVPANKGLRRPGYAPGRMRETQFKKGQQPRNTVPVGTVQLNSDGYLRIKVADEPESIAGKGGSSTNWEFVHRRVWEEAHGPIPKAHRLWWKDGNHLNCALENLELLSDKDCMGRTTIHNLPLPLKQVIQLAGVLKRVIRRRANAEEQTGRPKESPVRNAGGAEG